MTVKLVKYCFVFVFFAIFSCSPKIKHFDLYQKQFISKSQFLPDADQVNGKTPKIVVFKFDENNNQVATQANVGLAIANNVENILTKNKLAELIDRKSTQKLKDEIKLSELNKTGSFKGPKVADYAISGAISNASFTKKYKSGSNYYNPKTKSFISIPPRFEYKSQINGNLKIYELPSMTVMKNIEFVGGAKREENVKHNGGFSLGAINIGGTKEEGANRDDNLVRKAAFSAINDIEIELKNALATKGYILEKRQFKKKNIFKISLGSNHGLKIGDEFVVIGKYEIQNPITQEIEVERRIVAKGKVSDIINPKTSWVIIDKDKTQKIRLGDIIQMKYKRNLFQKVIKTTKKIAL